MHIFIRPPKNPLECRKSHLLNPKFPRGGPSAMSASQNVTNIVHLSRLPLSTALGLPTNHQNAGYNIKWIPILWYLSHQIVRLHARHNFDHPWQNLTPRFCEKLAGMQYIRFHLTLPHKQSKERWVWWRMIDKSWAPLTSVWSCKMCGKYCCSIIEFVHCVSWKWNYNAIDWSFKSSFNASRFNNGSLMPTFYIQYNHPTI